MVFRMPVVDVRDTLLPAGQSTQVNIADLNRRWLIIEGEQDARDDRISAG